MVINHSFSALYAYIRFFRFYSLLIAVLDPARLKGSAVCFREARVVFGILMPCIYKCFASADLGFVEKKRGGR
jgi:hypothetical protein